MWWEIAINRWITKGDIRWPVEGKTKFASVFRRTKTSNPVFPRCEHPRRIVRVVATKKVVQLLGHAAKLLGPCLSWVVGSRLPSLPWIQGWLFVVSWIKKKTVESNLEILLSLHSKTGLSLQIFQKKTWKGSAWKRMNDIFLKNQQALTSQMKANSIHMKHFWSQREPTKLGEHYRG